MKKILLAILVLCVISGSFYTTGCSRSNNDDNTLIIDLQLGGYGRRWLDALKDAYVKENPTAKIKINTFIETTEAETLLNSGKTSTDIYFTFDPLIKYQFSTDCKLEDLTSFVYNEKISEEEKTIAQKINKVYLDYYKVKNDAGQEKIYNLPWAIGVLGIVRNKMVWKDEWKIPNTTDELISLCNTIKQDGVPFIYSLKDSYYNYLLETFIAQYEGVDTMDKIWQCINQNGEQYKPSFIMYDGILEAYKILDTLLKESNGYQHSLSKDKTYTGAQSLFLEKNNKIAMMVNGDWLQEEMRTNYKPEDTDLEFIKTPVISSIKNKFNNEDKYMTDATLSAIISKIDNGVQYSKIEYGCEEETYEKVKEARNIVATNGNYMSMFIPAISGQKDLAKDFISFMISDKGLSVFEKTIGYALPYDYDYLGSENVSGLTNFIKKSLTDMYYGKIMYPALRKKDRIFSKGGLNIINNSGSKFEAIFSASNINDYKSPEDVVDFEYNYIKASWNKYLSAAGIM